MDLRDFAERYTRAWNSGSPHSVDYAARPLILSIAGLGKVLARAR